MDVDPVEALRAELAVRGVSPMQQPDDEMLRMMLDVEHGSVTRAARAISDAQLAEDRHSVTASSIDSPTRGAPTPPAQTPAEAPAPTSPGRAVTHESVWDTRWLAQLWRVVSLPFSLLGTILLVCLRALGIVRPLPRGASGRFGPSRFAEDPRASARSWIAELERDTHGTLEADGVRTLLPPFFAGSYAEALVHAKEHIHILVVVLTSAAHADNDYFRTRVLTDPQLVDTLRGTDMTVWGGDVRAREAHQVASLLRATTYPFVAFVALQPRRSRSRGAVVAHPAVLSRLEGSPHTTLSAASICAHIHEVLLPRTAAYLGQLRGERDHRERERQLKAEQDRAYAEASARDQDRVLARRAEAAQRAEAERARVAAAVAQAAQAAQQAQWRRWARTALVPAEPPAGAEAVRLSVHLPSGRNLQRRFASDAPLEAVYAYVDTADSEGDAAPAPPDGYVHTYAFQLVQTYPRHTLDTAHLATPLKALPHLGKSANLVVETSADAAAHASDASDASDAEDA
ncbi:UBX domain-containing protein 10 [Malassezia brasiliensis]|uniref:UBX domain-containing protein 10 n=1 Tax=Malassezia brasiliensis TaxID=1821822 RepID=A0AAF0DVD1_9BASI|nr:UBX domain-containing protein 10 [Malassezia brasiliensis]